MKENPPDISMDRTVKFAIGGKLIKGEFRTVASRQPPLIVQGILDKDSQNIINFRIVEAKKIEPDLAREFATGDLVVFNDGAPGAPDTPPAP
jgi:hypothetical protein